MHSNGGTWLYLANSVLLVGGVLLLSFAFHTARRDLLTPMSELHDWANRMRNGQLTARLPEPLQPDFSNLYRDINLLSERL